MRKLRIFNFITLNGCFEGPGRDIGWHMHGEEENEHAVEMLHAGHLLLFGRVTYELMAGYWTTSMAMHQAPVVAQGMNNAEKIVFSRTLESVSWNNTTLVKEDAPRAIALMKQSPGQDMAILGSGSIVSACARHGLIDEYQIMVDPVVVGGGTHIFSGLDHRLDLRLIRTKTLKSGAVLLWYEST